MLLASRILDVYGHDVAFDKVSSSWLDGTSARVHKPPFNHE